MKLGVAGTNPFALDKAKVSPPGTMVRYTHTDGRRLVGLVVARKEPLSDGGLPIHLVVWSDGTMSQHVYCERMF
jgi:hypothetical protein